MFLQLPSCNVGTQTTFCPPQAALCLPAPQLRTFARTAELLAHFAPELVRISSASRKAVLCPVVLTEWLPERRPRPLSMGTDFALRQARKRLCKVLIL